MLPDYPDMSSFAPSNNYDLVRSDVFTAVTMKNVAFWDVTLCLSYRINVSVERSATIIKVKNC
jgi:hypothetical protein